MLKMEPRLGMKFRRNVRKPKSSANRLRKPAERRRQEARKEADPGFDDQVFLDLAVDLVDDLVDFGGRWWLNACSTLSLSFPRQPA